MSRSNETSSASPAEQVWHLAALFDQLVELPAFERAQRLAALEPDLRESLERLLALDVGSTRQPPPGSDALAQALAEAVRPSAAPPPGASIGPYRVLRELGSGGMGTVLLAERVGEDFVQQVAIKLIRGFPTEDERRRLRFERRILAQLDHPNIARLLDGGETTDGQPYVVMEFVDGLPLLEHVAQHALDLRQRLALFDRIADAVQHAHERLVIHRDLKPSNVMVRGDGEPRLLDFGVAKLVDVSQGADSRQTSTRVWTPGYASPEQRSGGLITTASDVYGLSVLLREMLTGERQLGQANPLPAGFIGLKLDAELRGILEAAGAEDPAQRYPTVEALRDDLTRWRDGRTVRVAPDSARYRLRKFVRRHRGGVAIAAGLLMLALAFVWRLGVERDRALDAEARATVAQLAAEDEAANARAALDFLSGTLLSMSPEATLSSEISVRALLDSARDGLAARLGARPRVQREVMRLLGHLYAALSEPAEAVRLFEAGLEGAEPRQRGEALALAADLDEYSGTLGLLERSAESLAAAERAAALRQQFAPEDAVERLRSRHALAYAHYRDGDLEQAEALWREVIEQGGALPALPLSVLDNAHQALAGLLGNLSRSAEALTLLDAGDALMRGRVDTQSPERVSSMRVRIEALVQLGRVNEAEALLRRAMDIQTGAVGERSVRMAYLLNSLGLVMNEQGRFREAMQAFESSRQMSRELQGVDSEDAMSLLNLAAVTESAGDYAQAVQLFDQALPRLAAAEADPDSLRLRQARRSRARAVGLGGAIDGALEDLAALEALALKLDGADAFEPAMTAWQQAVLLRAAARPGPGLNALQRAVARMQPLLPAEHPLFAYAHRLRGAFLAMQGEQAAAADQLDSGLRQLKAHAGVPLDIAVMQAERAAVHALAGEREAARALLQQALPVLREAVLPSELNRAAAERLAQALGLQPDRAE